MDVSKNACGECSVCCKDLMFDIGPMRKLAGVMCPHCASPGGCSVYETRWDICRTYYCGWRHLGLDEEWRPDRSGILISLREGPSPDGLQNGVEFELVGAHAQLHWLPLIKFIAALIEDKAPVYLSLPGEIGYQSPWVYLNNIPALNDGIARRDLAATTAALSEALQVCLDFPKTRLPEAIENRK
jgi:hypothetical protein